MAAAANGSRCGDRDDLDGHQDYLNWLIPQKRNVRFEDNRDSTELPFWARRRHQPAAATTPAERAAAELAEARRLSGDGRYSSGAPRRRRTFGVPKTRALFETSFFAGLRKAGMPEE
jgi:hypothetical protein